MFLRSLRENDVDAMMLERFIKCERLLSERLICRREMECQENEDLVRLDSFMFASKLFIHCYCIFDASFLILNAQ